MEIRWTFVASVLIFGLFLIVLPATCSTDDQIGSEIESEPPASVKRPLMRRRIVRKRINGDNTTSTHNVSVSMSVSEGDGDAENATDKDFGTRRPLFSKFRSSFMNRTRPTFMTTPVGIPTTADPMETPNSSFKLRMRPRMPFGRIRTTANSITDDEDEKEESSPAKSTTTFKPFLQRKFFKQRVIHKSSTTTTEEPTLEDTDDEPELEDEAEESDAEDATEILKKPANDKEEVSSRTSTEVKSKSSNRNSSMIIIPVPPSQRKPYHPVIMQVTKTPTTAESLAETKVVTYKLNKMFVPMGIYGKVLPKSASPADLELTSRNTIVSTPLPFLLSGQDNSQKKATKKEKGEKSQLPSTLLKTPSPEIKVKGHRSKEVEVVEEPMATSGDSSRDYASAVAYATSQKEHHMRQQRQWQSMMDKLKEKHRKNIVDTISLTYDSKPTVDQISLTTERVNVGDISLTSERSPLYDNRRAQAQQQQWNMKQQSSVGSKNGFHELAPPQGFRPAQAPTKSIFQTITSAASSIPGMIHDGITSLTGYPSPFEDDTFSGPAQSARPQPPQNPITSASQQAPTISSDAETLEFFRKRPYLLNGRNLGGKDNFIQPEYSSGFKPVSAPVHFASQYYASTPKPSQASSTTQSTVEAYFAQQRDPLFEGSQNWLVTSTPRTPKQFSLNDFSSWKAASSQNSLRHPFSGFGFTSSTTLRPSYLMASSTPASFTSQWLDFNRKYSKSEIEAAKERVFNLFAGPEPPTHETMMFMKPPAQSKQSLSNGGAFDDLLKMFRMGFNFGSGHTSSNTPMISYSAGMQNEDTVKSASNDGWKPLTKPGGTSPVISLNAGITFKGKPTPTPMYPGYGSGSHYSSSIKPYAPPKSQYKEFFNPKLHHSSISSSNYAHSFNPAPTSDYVSNLYSSYKRPETSYNHFDTSPAVLKDHASHFKSTDLRHLASGSESYSPSSLALLKNQYRQYSNDPAIEIIPSSVFFKQKGNMADIAAIIKPPELSSDMVKAALPPQIASVPQLSYPTQQLIQNPNHFTSLSQLQHYFATAQPQPTMQPTALYNPVALHHFQQQQMPGQFVYLPQQHQQHHYVQHPRFNSPHVQQLTRVQSSSQGGGLKSAGDPTLGFSDFELPAGLDPDIASLIKTELEKDDVPEEYRKDFAKAKEEEKSQKQGHSHTKYHHQQPQTAGSSLRVTVLKPHEDLATSNRRSDSSKLDIKFHKPVPITPTMITPVKGKPIRASPVPRYVVELARKLKSEKDVQGIVRVSTKRERGPPIEYLYPVRG